jgi:outer membrane protein assembly factor BamB
MRCNCLPVRGVFGFINCLAWLMLLSNPARGEGVPSLTNEWAVSLVRGPCESAPALGADGTVYFGAWPDQLWALNPDGSRKWVFYAHNQIRSSPAVGLDGTVYFGSRDRRFYAVRADGRKHWEFLTGAWVDSSPALARDGTLYFGSWDKAFYALNADGTRKWQFQTTGPIVSSPAVGIDDTIYFGSHDKKFYALSPDGRRKWEFATGGPIISSPALGEDQTVYFTSVDGWFYALSADGRLRWRLRTGGITESSPVIGRDGLIYVAVNASWWGITPDGTKQWENVQEGPIENSAVALADSSMCFLSYYGLLSNRDRDHALRWNYYLYGFRHGSPAIGPTGTIYVPDNSIGNFGAGFTALRASTPLAQTPWPKFRGNARNTGNVRDMTH